MPETTTDPYDTPEYRAYEEVLEAIATGRAIELVHCYICWMNENPGQPPVFSDQYGPLRGVVRVGTTPGPDPYRLLTLAPCGHQII